MTRPEATASEADELPNSRALHALALALTGHLARPCWMRAVCDSRLLPRDTPGPELRRRFPDPESWVRFVVDESYLDRSRREAALRALSLLASEYLKDGRIEPRVQTALRKARTASERSEFQAVRRYVANVQEFARAGNDPILAHAGLLVFLICPAHTRPAIRMLLVSTAQVSDQQPPAAPIAKVEVTRRPSSLRATSPGSAAPDSVSECVSRPLAEDVTARLRKALTERIKPLEARVLESWPLEDVARGVVVSPLQPSWAAVEPRSEDLESLLADVRSLANRRPQRTEGAAADERLSWLTELEGVGVRAKGLRSQFEADRARLVEEVRAYAARLPAEYADEARRAVARLDGVEFEAAADELARLGDRAHADARLRLSDCVPVAKRIEELVRCLHQGEQSIFREKTLEALRASALGTLAELERGAENAGRERLTMARRDASLAEMLLHHLEQGADEMWAARVLESVGVGDLPGAAALVPQSSPTPPATRPDSAPPRSLTSPPVASTHETSPPPRATSLDGIIAPDRFVARNRFTGNLLRGAPRTDVDPQSIRDQLERTTAVGEAVQLAATLACTKDATARSFGTLQLLTWRALQEAERGSVLGIIEHALDIIHLASTATPPHVPWACIGIALLAVEPSGDPALPDLIACARDTLEHLGDRGLQHAFNALLASPNRDVLVAERLAAADLSSFASIVARGLFDAASIQTEPRAYVMEDVARGLLLGLEHADRLTAASLLAELAALDGLSAPQVEQFRSLLAGDRSLLTAAPPGGPEWFHQVLLRLRSPTKRRPPPGAVSSPNVQVPQSVAKHGGFTLRAGGDPLELAVLVSRPRGRPAVAVELAILASRNPKLVAADSLVSVGSIWPGEQHVVPLRLELHDEFDESQREVRLNYQVRWGDPAGAEVSAEDRYLTIPLTPEPAKPVRDYFHADGRPLLLREEELRLSSKSVRDSLEGIRSGLQQGSLAALLIGRRRRGKTSILETIRSDAEVQANYVVLTDIREDLPFRTFPEALSHLGGILDHLPRRIGIAPTSTLADLLRRPGAGWTEIQSWLELLSEKINRQIRVLLLIDEFQKWISNLDPDSIARLLSIFRGLFNRPASATISFSIILSGLTNIEAHASRSADFKNAFRPLKLKPFTQEETDALIRSNDSIEFDNRSIEAIRDLSGGNPFLVNLLGSLIASALRDAARGYCLPEDVQRVVDAELRDEQSRVRSFVQYLLKKGEEDHAEQIVELPALVALAWAFPDQRGRSRLATVERVLEELRRANVEVDEAILREWLASAVESELLVTEGARYGFANAWLKLWLRRMNPERPLPITGGRDADLVLNRYRVSKRIGAGGQAEVFKALDTNARRAVILKIYPRHGGMSSLAMPEVEALSRVEHAGVVRCLDHGRDEEKGDVLVLEFVGGRDLRSYLASPPESARSLIGKNGKLGLQIQFIAGLARALAECHRAGVIHKDVKPENVLIREEDGLWFPVLIDFGLSHAGAELLDHKTVDLYTPGYVAPERYQGETRRAASDVYSLGVVAYEILTGACPFPSNPLEAERAQREGHFLPLSEARPDVPARLSELVAAMLSAEPTRRPDAAAIQRELPLALEPLDWRDASRGGDKAYEDTDVPAALDLYEKAAFLAPRDERLGAEYAEVLDRLIVVAGLAEEARRLELYPRIAQMVAYVALNGVGRDHVNGGVALRSLVVNVAELGVPDEQTKRLREDVLDQVVRVLLDHEPRAAALPLVQSVLGKVEEPLIVDQADNIFLIASLLVNAGLLQAALVISFCLSMSARFRRLGEPRVSQVWLRRAAGVGAANNHEVLREQEEVERLLRRTAAPQRLPPNPAHQASADDAVGEDERGHLHVARIRAWARRLLRLHRYVEAVRRVRKDGGIPAHTTRILDLQNLAQHIVSGSEDDASRIVPVVLDGSYSKPGGVALRMNIILPHGTTESERLAAIEALKQDTSLFGG